MLRTHLILARASNLPTVWSNVLCAWILSRGFQAFAFDASSFLQLWSYLIGASLVYTGGMYLNDYCDREFDALHRQERPIPSGKISPESVRNSALSLLGLGFLAFAWVGILPASFAAALVASVVVYDKIHKSNAASPIFMAACRGLLYLAVAAGSPVGLDSVAYFAAGAVFVFILGVTYLARTESTTNAIDYPALAMIAAPIVAAFYYRPEFFDAQRGAILALFIGWNALAFARARSGGRLVIGKTIGPLLASLPLLDLLILSSLGFATQSHLFLFAALFALTTAFQRVIAPT